MSTEAPPPDLPAEPAPAPPSQAIAGGSTSQVSLRQTAKPPQSAAPSAAPPSAPAGQAKDELSKKGASTPSSKKKPALGDVSEWVMQREAMSMRLAALEEKLDRRKNATRDLERHNRQLSTTLDGERESNSEVFGYLKKQLADKIKEAADLEDRLSQAQQDVESMQQRMESITATIKAQQAENMTRLQHDNERLLAEVARLSDLLNKQQEEGRMSRIEIDLERKAFKEQLSDLELKCARDMQKQEKQRDDEIKKARQTILGSTYTKLDSVTKSALAENERLADDVSRQGKQLAALMAENKKLKEDTKELKRSVELHEDTERELAKKSQAMKRRIAELEKQQAGSSPSTPSTVSKRESPRPEAAAPALPAQAAAAASSVFQGVAASHTSVGSLGPANAVSVAADQGTLQQQLAQEQQKNQALLEKVHTLDLRVRILDSQLAGVNEDLEHTRQELAGAAEIAEEAKGLREEMRQLLDSHDEATWFILACLDDARKELPPSERGGIGDDIDDTETGEEEEPPERRLDDLSRDEREKVLTFFLTKLHTYKIAAAGGIVRAPAPVSLPPSVWETTHLTKA
eukprot:m51a1_g9180 hypothetical protein (575) ;mRNA; r:54467-56662